MKTAPYFLKIAKYLPLLSLLICPSLLFAATTAVPAQTGSQCDQLWQRLDLDQPGLAEVKAAVLAHDDAKAMKALNAHFQGRVPQASGKARGASKSLHEVADNALAFRFRRRASDDYFTLHKDFDWHKGPASRDGHWLPLFSSLGILNEMAQAYAQTGDPKYAAGVMALFNDWSDNVPLGTHGTASWSLATTMIRVDNFLETFKRLLYWPDWPVDQEARFLNSIAIQADFMASRRGPGNQDATNSETLMRVGGFFPEFKNAPAWVKTGHERLVNKIFDDTLADGSQVELCSGYDKGAVATYTKTLKTMKDAGQPLAPGFEARLEKMYDWLLRMSRPDGDIPSNGDSAGGSVREFLKKGAELFNRPDMAYAASNGASGTPPAFLDAALPDAGYYTLRSGWNADALYLFMDIARQEPLVSHQYNDALHIFLFAYGRDFFPATGTLTYGGDASKKAHATPSQNTVAVDNANQAEVASVTHAFFSSNALSFLDGSQAGYPGITHRRQVLFVRPDPAVTQALPYFIVIDRITGKGTHRTDQYFHLPADSNPKVDNGQARFQTTFAKGPNLIVENLENGITTEMFTDDMFPNQGVRVQRPVVAFRQNAALPLTYVTLLFPYPDAAPVYTAKVLATGSDPAVPNAPGMIAVQVTQGDVTDTLFAAPDSFSATQTAGASCAGMIRAVNGATQTTWVPAQKPVTGKFTVLKAAQSDSSSTTELIQTDSSE